MLSYEELGAYRIQEQDYTDNEENIIKYLKSLLMNDHNMGDVEASLHLQGFYEYIGIDMDYETIYQIEPYVNIDEPQNINDNIQQIFQNIVNQLNNPPPQQPLEDVPVTINEEDLEKLPIEKFNSDEEIECSICRMEMEKEDEYFNIECKHMFHKECLEKWLTECNYTCPVCRIELGSSNPHIDDVEQPIDEQHIDEQQPVEQNVIHPQLFNIIYQNFMNGNNLNQFVENIDNNIYNSSDEEDNSDDENNSPEENFVNDLIEDLN